MNSKINKILEEHGFSHLIEFLSTELKESELNSLLLEVFRLRSQNKTLSKVLKDYSESRFSRPSTINFIRNLKYELELAQICENHGFELMEFSPLTPFGTSSVHKAVDQNNVVSSLRRMEVMSDITNVIALEISKRIKENSSKEEIEIGGIQRLVRSQSFDDPNYSAHFKILGVASSWLESKSSNRFQKILANHICMYLEMMKEVYRIEERKLKILLKFDESNTFSDEIDKEIKSKFSLVILETKIDPKQFNNYYQGFRFGISVEGMHYPIVDGGLVNWVANFTQNRKRKMLISGIGVELLYKLFNWR